MRNFTLLIAAAPLAMLAACGDGDVEETEVDTEMATTEGMETDAMASSAESGSGVATSQADAGDYSGVYSYEGEDGTSNAVRLNASDNTYEYVGADDEVRSGSYTWEDDGYRLRIEDFDGSPAWFTISDGDLVRLQGDSEVNASTTVQGERYARAQEDDAVFSRFPELGSPVAPTN